MKMVRKITRSSLFILSKDGNPLTMSKPKTKSSSVIVNLQKQKQQLGITDILSHLDNKEIEKQLTSEYETIILKETTIDQNTW